MTTTLNLIVRIDNQIVERLSGGGIIVGPIKLFERQHRVRLDLQEVPYVSTGTRLSDNLFIQRLMDSDNPDQFLNHHVVYPSTNYMLK
jgi:hypothetical protein